MDPVLDCDAVMRQLWSYLDRELTEDRQQAIKAHLKVCGRCYPAFRFEEGFFRTVAGSDGPAVAPDQLRERVHEVLRREGLSRPE